MVYNILIVGAGQLGSRHLQSVKTTNLEVKIFVYDISSEALKMAEERYLQIPNNKNIKEIKFITSLEQSERHIDFAIIATGSKGRAKIISKVLSLCYVNYMLIEKVLFQSLEEYSTVQKLLAQNKVEAWVNCPRRMNDFYKELSGNLSGETISVIIEGYQWGLGCNAIHFIDLVSFLTNCSEYTIEEKLDKQILKSKREGYIEFSGELRLAYRNGTKCRIISHALESYCPMILTITLKHCRILVDESKGKVFISKMENDWNWETKEFKLKYQSELTSEVFESLVVNNDCELTRYEESMQLHRPLIEMLLGFLDKNYQSGIKNCPIT